jgi:hypothetical protein
MTTATGIEHINFETVAHHSMSPKVFYYSSIGTRSH